MLGENKKNKGDCSFKNLKKDETKLKRKKGIVDADVRCQGGEVVTAPNCLPALDANTGSCY